MASHTPKSQQNFSHFFATATKMGQIREIQAHYFIKYTLITNWYDVFIFFDSTHFSGWGKKCKKNSLAIWSMGRQEKMLVGLTDL